MFFEGARSEIDIVFEVGEELISCAVVTSVDDEAVENVEIVLMNVGSSDNAVLSSAPISLVIKDSDGKKCVNTYFSCYRAPSNLTDERHGNSESLNSLDSLGPLHKGDF